MKFSDKFKFFLNKNVLFITNYKQKNQTMKLIKFLPFVALFAIAMVAFTFKQTPKATKGVNFFHGTFKEALAKAKKENKLVMMDCYTVWCGPCKMLKSKVFTDKGLGDVMNSKYVCIAVDYENGEGPAIAEKYPVEGFPTLFFMDANGKVKKKVVGVPNGNPVAALTELAKSIK